MSIEAMKQALEAFERGTTGLAIRVIPALRQAIEQAEKQEPVCDKDPHLCWSVRCQLGKVCKNTAPPKREWVGLTEEEIHEAAIICVKSGQSVNAAIRAIEAKLRERNT